MMSTQILRAPARRLSDQRGFTLVELLIVTLLLLIVLTATLALLDKSTSVAARDQERNNATTEVNAGIQRLVNDIRQAHTINAGDSWQIDLTLRCRANEPTVGASSTAVCQSVSTIAGGYRTKRVVWRCDAEPTGASNLATATVTSLYRDCTRAAYPPTTTPSPAVGNDTTRTTPVSGDETSTGSPPCSTLPGSPPCTTVIRWLKNWDNRPAGVCPAGRTCYPDTATTSERIFFYRLSNSVAEPSAVKAEEIDMTVRVPRSGERRLGIGGDVLLKDAAYLRNLDLF